MRFETAPQEPVKGFGMKGGTQMETTLYDPETTEISLNLGRAMAKIVDAETTLHNEFVAAFGAVIGGWPWDDE